MTKSKIETRAETRARGIAMAQASIARTDWKAVAEDHAKELSEIKEREEYKDRLIVQLQERIAEALTERNQWAAAHKRMTDKNDAEVLSRERADRDTTTHARRADFWKGVAMGFDPVRASAIEERQGGKVKTYAGGDYRPASLMEELYPKRQQE
jgi:hypothetical protein